MQQPPHCTATLRRAVMYSKYEQLLRIKTGKHPIGLSRLLFGHPFTELGGFLCRWQGYYLRDWYIFTGLRLTSKGKFLRWKARPIRWKKKKR